MTQNSNLLNLIQRPRRVRRTDALRRMIQETQLTVNDLIYPLFVMEGENQKVEVPSMPGSYRYTLDLLLKEVAEAYELIIFNVGVKTPVTRMLAVG
jgi:porphobilinogen synthase